RHRPGGHRTVFDAPVQLKNPGPIGAQLAASRAGAGGPWQPNRAISAAAFAPTRVPPRMCTFGILAARERKSPDLRGASFDSRDVAPRRQRRCTSFARQPPSKPEDEMMKRDLRFS